LVVALTVTIIIARFTRLVCWVSIIVVGICGEALYSLYRSSAG
jgi:hypothetical protein